jgi:hypothetical protein
MVFLTGILLFFESVEDFLEVFFVGGIIL